MTITTDSRTDAEKRYDSLKDGSFYTQAPATPEDPRILIAREADAVLAALPTSAPLTGEARLAVFRQLDAIAEEIGQQRVMQESHSAGADGQSHQRHTTPGSQPAGMMADASGACKAICVDVGDNPFISDPDPADAIRAQLDVERDYATRSQLVDQLSAIMHARRAVLHAARFNHLIGYIEGCEVRADYAADACDPTYDVLSEVSVVWRGMKISTDGALVLSFPFEAEFTGDIPLDQWEHVKRLAHTDVPEQLIALAKRYPRVGDVPRDIPPVPALPDIDAQIATITPGEVNQDILDVTLPTGETFVRTTVDGHPGNWIDVRLGAVELAVDDAGRIIALNIGGEGIEDERLMTVANLRDLRTVLVRYLDRVDDLAALADVGPAVKAAQAVWRTMEYGDVQDIIESTGFGAWYGAWQQGHQQRKAA